MTKHFENTMAANFDQFWALELGTGCHQWSGGTSKGYGVLKWNGKNTKAYRFAYERTNGPVPKGMHVLHRCHNTRCVNPQHLYIGTHQDNMHDRLLAGHYTTNASGERHHNAKLTRSEAEEIRRLVSGGMFQRDAGRIFGIKQQNVSDIVHRKIWT